MLHFTVNNQESYIFPQQKEPKGFIQGTQLYAVPLFLPTTYGRSKKYSEIARNNLGS